VHFAHTFGPKKAKRLNHRFPLSQTGKTTWIVDFQCS
jgi:hypothetical protein